MVTRIRAIWSLFLSPGGWIGHSHSLAGKEGNGWWPSLQSLNSRSSSQKGSGPTWSSHWYHHLGSTTATWEGGRAGEREGERRKLPESLFLWGTKTVKIFPEDSTLPPFLHQSLLVLCVSSCWSELHWIKDLLDFISTKLWTVLLRK